MSDSFENYELNKVGYPSDNISLIKNFVVHTPNEKVEIRDENWEKYLDNT
ncbi:MAG: hypothetical protein LBU14_06770 [Candidatus Peribacteria bacterium]|jgi:hypothetical protein|nr:hypothetical protein [Candidatus Peribacteria bacterium]